MLRQKICIVIVGLIGFSFDAAAETVPESSPSTEEAAVMAVEDEWIRAEINRDEATLRRVIDDQFVFNGNNGQTSGKDALIENILGWNMTGQTLSERSALVSGDTAVIFGTTEFRLVTPENVEITSVRRYTAIYVKRDGRWQGLALHMAERTPDE